LLILIDERGKKYLLNSDQDFHNDLGIIKKEALQECQPGDILETHMGKNIKVVKADVNDLIELMQRRCSILLPKDIGIVISNTGLGCGNRVVDAGTGAGAIALHFANVVGNEGKVYSYEIREDFAQIARSNIDQFQFDNVEIKNKDIKEGIDEEDVDLVFLDLPKPWEMLESVYDALKAGGWLAVYAPYIEQVQILHRIAKKVGFEEVNTIECILREIEVKVKGTRPKTRMVGHTGYLSFARKL
jgi:tRNA (adenine57-N1/adenine58-N1)-methyltransferase catalytic subunit